MKIDWKYIRGNIIIGTLFAIGISVLISITTNIPLWVVLCVLLFNWPITEIIIECIATRNPTANKRITVRSLWPPLITLFIISIASVALHFAAKLNFWTAFAYSTLILTFAGAVNGIIAEHEDNAPGGWPKPKKDMNNSG